jgi:hypothetical protein
VAGSIGTATAGANSRAAQPPALVHDVQLAYAHSTQTIFYLMAATFMVAVRGLPRGRIEPVAISDALAPVPAPEFSR